MAVSRGIRIISNKTRLLHENSFVNVIWSTAFPKRPIRLNKIANQQTL